MEGLCGGLPAECLAGAAVECGGDGGQEIRNWIALLGAVPGWKGELLAYEPVPEWITGCATVWMSR